MRNQNGGSRVEDNARIQKLKVEKIGDENLYPRIVNARQKIDLVCRNMRRLDVLVSHRGRGGRRTWRTLKLCYYCPFFAIPSFCISGMESERSYRTDESHMHTHQLAWLGVSVFEHSFFSLRHSICALCVLGQGSGSGNFGIFCGTHW